MPSFIFIFFAILEFDAQMHKQKVSPLYSIGETDLHIITNVSRAKDLWNLVLPTCYDGPGLSDG